MINTRTPTKRAGTRADLAAYLRAARKAALVLKIAIHRPPYESPDRADSLNVYLIKAPKKGALVVEWFLTVF